MRIFTGLVLSYLIGSLPTGYVLGRLLKGIDIRHYGSGNVGATNAFRALGKGPGLVVLIIDILKGALAVVALGSLLSLDGIVECVLLGIAVVCGHNWTIFLRFRGGKGIATSLGVLIGLAIKFAVLRPVLLLTLFVWIITFILSHTVSLASLVAALALPCFMMLTRQVIEIVILGWIFCVFVLVRHWPNIQRLIRGEESKIRLSSKTSSERHSS
ncbi:MAG: glycerol-3-phosphate 1-O-acyltransferase PlsY [Candidatus Omnitrophota bacterium]